MINYRLALGIWLCIAGTAFADSSPATNLPAVITITNVVTATNIVTLTNTVTLANTIIQILPANQTNGLTILVAFISACIALVAVFFAIQQFLLAKEKFKQDMFEKRFKVYCAIDAFLESTIPSQKLTFEQFRTLHTEIKHAEFLFENPTLHLIYTISSKASRLSEIDSKIDDITYAQELPAMQKEKQEILSFFLTTLQNLNDAFSPYLKFKQWKHGMIWNIK
jgi:hypothetical protein